jgi:hypothetical protein
MTASVNGLVVIDPNTTPAVSTKDITPMGEAMPLINPSTTSELTQNATANPNAVVLIQRCIGTTSRPMTNPWPLPVPLR